jgi:uncharacterized protein (TIGR02996 family)
MRFSPLDDTARLVAADWLQDTGRPELEAWAEFVRFQVEAARNRPARTHLYTDSCDCEACRPERRAAILHDRWAAYWGAHAFGHVTLSRKVGSASDFDRGFIRCVTATLKDWKVAEVPKDVIPLYKRTPLPVALIHLDDLRNGWVLRVTQEVRHTGVLAVVAVIEPTPNVPGAKPFRAVRVVDQRNIFARGVGGAVRQALANRHECLPPATNAGVYA